MTRSVNQVSSALEADPVVAELIEELASRLRAGEPVDVEAFLEEHPAQAEPLRRLLPTIQVLAELGRSGASGSAPPLTCDGDPASGTLGDFRLLRELGRVLLQERLHVHRLAGPQPAGQFLDQLGHRRVGLQRRAHLVDGPGHECSSTKSSPSRPRRRSRARR